MSEQHNSGSKLKVIEGLILAGLVALVASNLMLRDAVVRLQANGENMSQQMLSLRTQLADVPALTQRVTTLEVKAESNAESIRELRGVRGLK